jgi:hypothetical protein
VYIFRKFNTAHAVWFKKSKSFLLLEEPAFEVLQNYSNGIEKYKIIEICEEKFGHLEANIRQFVDEIIQHIQFCNDPENAVEISVKNTLGDTISAESFLPAVTYKLGEKFITINYESEDLKFAIHPLIAHLESDDTKNSEHNIECFQHNDLLILKHNKKVVEAFHINNMEYFTGATTQLMHSILYGYDFNHWMTMLHASGIYSNNHAILFSAASGKGKSTISAIFKAKGYGYLSDDIIAADNNGKVYPFPAAISIKEGSIEVLSEYFPEISKMDTKETFIGKMVKYIPIQNITPESMNGIPVKAFVFVNYSKSGDFIFEEAEKKQALQTLLKETWVNPTARSVSAFFDWMEETDFYNLQYSNIDEALGVINKILGAEIPNV